MSRILTPWTDEMKARLRELHRQDDEPSFLFIALLISAEFGRVVSRNACIGIARRMELPMRGRRGRFSRTPKQPRTRKPKPQPHAIGAAVPEEELPIEPAVEPAERPFGACDIYQLRPITSRPSTCRWPLGPMISSTPYIYCGEATFEDSPYCAHHTERAFVSSRPLRARGMT